MVRTTLFVSLLLLLSGCVGIGYESLNVSETQVSSPDLAETKGQVYGQSTSPIQTDTLLKLWGEPDNKVNTETGEAWTYQLNEANSGVFALFFIIPIPVIFDDGFEQATLMIENDEVVSVTYRYQHQGGGFCFLSAPMYALPDNGCALNTKGELIDGVPSHLLSEKEQQPIATH